MAFNSIYEKLLYIQQNLVAPKNMVAKETKAKYHYRTAEYILEQLKPILKEVGCTLRLFDELVEIGGRIYIKATVMLCDGSDQTLSSCAFARECESLVGMSAPQITGAVSSFARKYALCGLFAIDGNKDIDELPQQEGRPTAANKAEEILGAALDAAIPDKPDVYPYGGLVEALKATKPEPKPSPQPAGNVDELPF